MDAFDTIIIGAGAAGAVLANRLSADPSRRVCLVEAGREPRAMAITMPAGLRRLRGHPAYDWSHVGQPQPELNGRRMTVHRGKGLGGSTLIDSMIYLRGAARDYDGWAAQGCTGWAWADVLPLFKALEGDQTGRPATQLGRDGPLRVERPQDPMPATQRFLQAAAACGLPERDDLHAPDPAGVALYDVTQNLGARWSSYDAFLQPVLTRPNLIVLTGTQVARLWLAGRRVNGVELRDGRVIPCRGEVVLAAGSIGSPEILMASGIGPGRALRAAGIDVRHDLPGVGQNLRDAIGSRIALSCKSRETLGLSLGALPAWLAAPWHYWAARKGMLTTNFREAGGFAQTPLAAQDEGPDLQLHFVPSAGGVQRRAWGHGFAFEMSVIRPRSVGELRLTRKETALTLEIDHRAFSDRQDALVLLEGIKLARQILAAPALAALGGVELHPGAAVQGDAAILAYLRAEAWTQDHPVGTCKMGSDPMAVVEPEGLRVRGIEGLRVADASIMPTLIAGNTNAPAMMIGEKCARAILAP